MTRTSLPTGFRRATIAVLVTILLAICSASIVKATVICDHCGKPITEGRWITIDGDNFHANHFLCAHCGADLTKQTFYEEAGKYYDSACYAALFMDACDYCGEPLVGKYMKTDSGKYHVSCYEEHIATRCAVCGEIISGRYFIDSRDNKFHAGHRDEYPECEYCGCLLAEMLTGEGGKYDDGRYVCGLCLKNVVGGAEEAEELMADVLAKLAWRGIIVGEEKIPLELIDRNRMRRISEGAHKDPLGYTTYKRTSTPGGVITDRDFRIYVLNGLPRPEFEFAIAHELMHVWLFKNASSDMDSRLCEGSCDYAATLVIELSEEPEAARVLRKVMENPDPVYGEGMRQVARYVENAGVRAWLEYLSENTQPPW